MIKDIQESEQEEEKEISDLPKHSHDRRQQSRQSIHLKSMDGDEIEEAEKGPDEQPTHHKTDVLIKRDTSKEEDLEPHQMKAKTFSQIPNHKSTRKAIPSQQRRRFKEYDGQKIPPDFDKAQEHYLANKVGPEKDINQIQEDEMIEYCECCARQVQRQQLSMKCNIYELSFLGSGYPLYFYFLKQCMILLILVLSCSGVFNVITNIIGSQKCTTDKNSTSDNTNTSTNANLICTKGSVFSIFSLGSKSEQNTFMEIQGYLNLATLIAMMGLLQWFRKLQRQLDAKCDDEDISANDYTVMIKNVPVDFEAINDDYDDDIKEYFHLNSLENKEVEVESVTLCYNITEITNIQRNKQRLIAVKKKYMQSIFSVKKQIDDIAAGNVKSKDEDSEEQEQGIKIRRRSGSSGDERRDSANSKSSMQDQKNNANNNQVTKDTAIHITLPRGTEGDEDNYKKHLTYDHCNTDANLNQPSENNSPQINNQIFNMVPQRQSRNNNLLQLQLFSKQLGRGQDNKKREGTEEDDEESQGRSQQMNNHIPSVPSHFIENKAQLPAQKQEELELRNKQRIAHQKEEFKKKQARKNKLISLNEELTMQTSQLYMIERKLDNLNKQFKFLNEKLMDGKGREFMKKYFTGSAFVCLKYEQDKEDIIDRYRPIGLSDKILSKEKNLVSHSMIYHNSKLKVIQAPDPTDVNWKNLHLSKSEKIKRRIYGFLFAVITLLACAFAIYGFYLFQQSEINNGASNDSNKLQIISSCLAILISILNFALTVILSIISAYCKYSTRTEGNIFIAKGLSLARFINSALISFIIQIFVQNSKDKQSTLFGEGGLADNANYFMISNCFVPAIVQLLNIEYNVLKVLRKIEAKKGVESLLTQDELNKLYEDPQFPIEERYAQLLMTMFTTAFYSPIVPISIIWSLIGIFLQYWIDKFILINRSSVKYNMSADLSIEMTEHLEYFLPIQSISTLIFYQYANGGDWGVSSIVGTGLGLLHAFLPMQLINERFFDVDKADANTIDYQEAQKYFITDYSRENPIYKQQARLTHVKKMTLRVSNQKNFLRQNTIRSPHVQLDDFVRITKVDSNENKSIFSQQQYNKNEQHLFLPFKTSDETEKVSYFNKTKTQETYQLNDDDAHNFNKLPMNSLEKKVTFQEIKQITNETNLGLIEEEMVSVNTNINSHIVVNSKQEHEFQQSPNIPYHNRSISTRENNDNNVYRSTLGMKIELHRVNQKSNVLESPEMQSSQKTIPLDQIPQELHISPQNINQNSITECSQNQNQNHHDIQNNQMTERSLLQKLKKMPSCEFQQPKTNANITTAKSSVFLSVQQNKSEKQNENLKEKYNQVRRNLNNLECFILPQSSVELNGPKLNEQQIEITIHQQEE